MSKNYAVRNLRLCTKDCLCLYVCPTGATDTENSIIGCRPGIESADGGILRLGLWRDGSQQ